MIRSPAPTRALPAALLSPKNEAPRRKRRLATGLVAVSAVLYTAACGSSKESAPQKDSNAAGAASAAVSGTSSAGAVAAPPEAPKPAVVRTFALERFAPEGSRPESVFAIDGALMVAERHRIGRVVGEKIEWVGEIPKEIPGFGRNRVESVQGAWPDGVDVLYRTDNGRAPVPTYVPLTGKGKPFVTGEGGSLGRIVGLATVGESTILLNSLHGLSQGWISVRGPAVAPVRTTPAQAGCEQGSRYWPDPPAVVAYDLEASRAGTLMAVGLFCDTETPAAEIWDKGGKPRIVDLTPWIKEKDAGYSIGILRGQGDELWLVGSTRILRYKDGTIEPLPKIGDAVPRAFVSAAGHLYGSDGRGVHRFDNGKWTLIGRFPWQPAFHRIVVDGEAFWASDWDAVYKLVDGPDVAYRDDCKTPFVYLYDVSSDNGKDFTFPSTRKALSTFPEVGDLELVEVNEWGKRRLGLTVKSRQQAEAVIAHVKENMKDEKPELLCYEPNEPRKIEMKAKGK